MFIDKPNMVNRERTVFHIHGIGTSLQCWWEFNRDIGFADVKHIEKEECILLCS